jgi:hypothetical protein
MVRLRNTAKFKSSWFTVPLHLKIHLPGIYFSVLVGEIRANKALLSLASTVFKSQLYSNFDEMNKAQVMFQKSFYIFIIITVSIILEFKVVILIK